MTGKAMALLDDIVINDGNKTAFGLMLSAPEKRDEPLNVFVFGPAGSGKTTMAQARTKTPDLMTGKHMSMCHATELIAFFNLGEMGERFLANIGEIEVLFLDGFEEAFSEEIGPMLCKLLLAARLQAGLETFVISDKPKEELDLSVFEGVLDQFAPIAVQPLDRDGLIEFVHKMEASYMHRAHPIEIGDDAAAYLVDEFCKDAAEIRNAVHFLVDPGTFESGTHVDAAMAREAFSA